MADRVLGGLRPRSGVRARKPVGTRLQYGHGPGRSPWCRTDPRSVDGWTTCVCARAQVVVATPRLVARCECRQRAGGGRCQEHDRAWTSVRRSGSNQRWDAAVGTSAADWTGRPRRCSGRSVTTAGHRRPCRQTADPQSGGRGLAGQGGHPAVDQEALAGRATRTGCASSASMSHTGRGSRDDAHRRSAPGSWRPTSGAARGATQRSGTPSRQGSRPRQRHPRQARRHGVDLRTARWAPPTGPSVATGKATSS